MTSDDRPARNATWPNGRPTKSLYDLPETLKILKEYGCTRKDLAQYLLDGELRAIGFPYRLEPDRAVNFEPSQFKRVWNAAWAFPIYDNYQGDEYLGDEPDSGRHTMPEVPLHMVPDAVDEETRMQGEDGKPIATSATVYIRHEALKKFVFQQFPEADGGHVTAETPEAVPGGLIKDPDHPPSWYPKKNAARKQIRRRWTRAKELRPKGPSRANLLEIATKIAGEELGAKSSENEKVESRAETIRKQLGQMETIFGAL